MVIVFEKVKVVSDFIWNYLIFMYELWWCIYSKFSFFPLFLLDPTWGKTEKAFIPYIHQYMYFRHIWLLFLFYYYVWFDKCLCRDHLLPVNVIRVWTTCFSCFKLLSSFCKLVKWIKKIFLLPLGCLFIWMPTCF